MTNYASWPHTNWLASNPGRHCKPRRSSTRLTCGWSATARRSAGIDADIFSRRPRPPCIESWSNEPGGSVDRSTAATETTDYLTKFEAGIVIRGRYTLREKIGEGGEYPSVAADSWYSFACFYAVASGEIADKKREYADRAMDLLQKAVKAGWNNAANMARDTDLDPLRGRYDFKKLLEELAKRRSEGPQPR